MSTVGRQDPKDPKLRLAQLVLQVGLRKEWAKTCSYWIEIYCNKLGGDGSKARIYYVYRQWSFKKGAEGEIIDGWINSSPCPSLTTAEQVLVEAIGVRQDKGDVVEYLTESEGWSGVSHRVHQALSVLNSKSSEKIRVKTDSKVSKFREAQLEREKKAVW